MPLTDVVFNTEAHAFPRFQMGKLFKTGWERKQKDAAGGEKKSAEIEGKSTEAHDEAQTVAETRTVMQTVVASAGVASTSAAAEATAVEPVVPEMLVG